MEQVVDIIEVAIPAILFGYSAISFIKYLKCAMRVNGAPEIQMSQELIDGMQNPECAGEMTELKFAMMNGTVKTCHNPINSIFNDVEKGVVQKLHIIEKPGWKNIFNVTNINKCIPFYIESNSFRVHITNALRADVLDLEPLQSCLERCALSRLDEFACTPKSDIGKIYDVTEQLLLKDEPVTIFGELACRNGNIVMIPPTNGTCYVISQSCIEDLKKRLMSRWVYALIATIIFGIATAVAIKHVKDRRENE